MNAAEIIAGALSGAAASMQAVAEGVQVAAAPAHPTPTAYTGGLGGIYGGPLGFSTVVSGQGTGLSVEAAARVLGIIAIALREGASQSATLGSYLRRWDEWKLQEALAKKELEQIQKQIDAATIRWEISKQDLKNHDLQRDNTQAVDDTMRSKFSNDELYDWMIGQIAAVFQSYQLAYDVAKRAERAFQFERGLTSTNFIQFGYWDSLRKGLLAGERLSLDLKRLELAYLEQNRRDYEITRHISLVLHDPIALIALKETGRCEVELPEALFDMDFPGHYMRRINSVSLTIPCVIGPYTSINCTLTLLSNRTRVKSVPPDPYPESEDGEDDRRFVTNFAALQSIATSHGQNDSGMFELNFRDERYLPFEGAGVISRWRIDLPKECNAFDFDTISDVILKMSYTAREGGDPLRGAARTAATLPPAVQQDLAFTPATMPIQENLLRMFSMKHEFPGEWYRFLHPADTEASQTLKFELTPERFPFQFRGKTITTSQVELFLKLKDGKTDLVGELFTVSIKPPVGDTVSEPPLTSTKSFLEGIPHAVMNVPSDAIGTWVLQAQKADITAVLGQPDAIEDLIIVCHYSVE